MILSLIDSSGALQLLEAQDILYMQTNGVRELQFYSYDERYKAISTLKDWSVLLQNEGFLQLDRGTIVNMILRVVTIPAGSKSDRPRI